MDVATDWCVDATCVCGDRLVCTAATAFTAATKSTVDLVIADKDIVPSVCPYHAVGL